jgi:hypothetical protein
VVNEECHLAGEPVEVHLVGDGRGWRWEVVEEGFEGRRDIQCALEARRRSLIPSALRGACCLEIN